MRLLEGRAFAGVMLVVVAAFAAGAVALLTITLVQADQITENADQVAKRISNANRDLEAVRLADRTSKIAAQIADELQPLDGQLGEVVRSTRSIDRTVRSIASTAVTIRDRAGVLQRLVTSVNSDVDDVQVRVAAILGNAQSINGRFGRVLATARSIDPGVAGININAEGVIAQARPVERDLRRVARQIGPGHGQLLDQTINGHVHDIDCSVLLRPESYC